MMDHINFNYEYWKKQYDSSPNISEDETEVIEYFLCKLSNVLFNYLLNVTNSAKSSENKFYQTVTFNHLLF